MKSKIFISTVMALSLSAGGLAFGQDYGNRNDRDHDNQGRNNQMQHGNDRDHDNQGRNDQMQHGNDRRGNDHRNNNFDARRDERGAGPEHQFHRGERLPPEYRNNQYVVDDWRGHHLSAPPRGYHWVQTGGDYVLAAIGTGIILQLLLNN
ncbi:RcnB family protein [Glaciimonas sp. PAMC28666]|uniref:RcnB family protein n=1 Tax=Glaciimonas sp. PAMC28666 TaxID=2807626 RepID=UPI001964148A|nr:RcnB family protein [Glaciimonas sp. PAMC28666]QRX82418.1 RcnB family protein [Glaciimonas sp. PAMC28666]